jgi:uncharacterized phage protein gp47/JayE
MMAGLLTFSSALERDIFVGAPFVRRRRLVVTPSAAGGKEFATVADVTIQGVPAWAPSTAYLVGARVTSSGKTYVCIDPGVSASSGGPTTEDAVIADGSVDWRFMGAGTGAADVDAQALETGLIAAVSGAITEIETPVSGWEGVINLLDAKVGRNEEKDEQLRVRRVLELAASGGTTREAVRAVLLKLEGVTAVNVFVNDSDVTNVDGMPPKSIEALVQGGADQDLWNALVASCVTAGIKAHGNTPGTAIDSQGTPIPVAFSRPTELPIYVVINLVKDPTKYPLDGNAAVTAAIVAFGNAGPTGRNAVASAISAQAFRVDGVLDVTSIFIGTAPAPSSSATIPISPRQLATYDTSRVVVNATDGVP